MTFVEAIGECFFNFMNFKGRAARAEYWWWALFFCVVILVAFALDIVVFFILGSANILPFLIVTYIALFFPTLSVIVRRLHDTNRSGWWLLLFYALNILTTIAAFLTGAMNPGVQVSGAGAVLVAVTAILTLACLIVLLIFMLLPSNPGNNRYGPNRYAGA